MEPDKDLSKETEEEEKNGSSTEVAEGEDEAGKVATEGREGDGEGDGEGGEEEEKPVRDAAWWENRAKHFEGEYRTERGRRQTLQKQSGGIQSREEVSTEAKQNGDGPKTLEQVESLHDLYGLLKRENRAELDSRLGEDKKQTRLVTSQDRARTEHNGSDGFPAYDDLVEETVLPLIEKNPRIYHLLREMPDPGEAAYTLGFLLKFPTFKDTIKGQGREELLNKINETTKKAVVLKGKKDTKTQTGKQTAAEILAMPPEEFEKEISKVTGRTT